MANCLSNELLDVICGRHHKLFEQLFAADTFPLQMGSHGFRRTASKSRGQEISHLCGISIISGGQAANALSLIQRLFEEPPFKVMGRNFPPMCLGVQFPSVERHHLG